MYRNNGASQQCFSVTNLLSLTCTSAVAGQLTPCCNVDCCSTTRPPQPPSGTSYVQFRITLDAALSDQAARTKFLVDIANYFKGIFGSSVRDVIVTFVSSRRRATEQVQVDAVTTDSSTTVSQAQTAIADTTTLGSALQTATSQPSLSVSGTTSPTVASSSSDDDDGLSRGQKAGIAIGALVGVALVMALIYGLVVMYVSTPRLLVSPLSAHIPLSLSALSSRRTNRRSTSSIQPHSSSSTFANPTYDDAYGESSMA